MKEYEHSLYCRTLQTPFWNGSKNIYETLTITAEIDKKYGVIVTASCTLATEHGRDFVQHLLKGHSLQDGIDKPVQAVKEHYLEKRVTHWLPH